MYEKEQEEIDSAAKALAEMKYFQALVRKKAISVLQVLDLELLPLEMELCKLKKQLAEKKWRTIGPWVVCDKYRYKSGRLYIHDSKRAWYDVVVWLRVVSGEMWTADITGRPEKTYKHMQLGLPSENPTADFEAHKYTVEEECRRLGYKIAAAR